MDDRGLIQRDSLKAIVSPRNPLPLQKSGSSSFAAVYFILSSQNLIEVLASKQAQPEHRYFILGEEVSVSLDQFRDTDQIYFLAAGRYFDSTKAQSPEWRNCLYVNLYRIFVMDHWEVLRSGYSFYYDDPDAAIILKDFIDTCYFQYVKFEDHNLKGKKVQETSSKGYLVYNNDSDPIMESLFDHLKERGERVFRINGKTGQLETLERDKEVKFPSPESFCTDLIKHNIHTVFFRNFYDMPSANLAGVSKLWIMDRLGIRAVSVVIDSLLDGVNPVLIHFLPKNVELLTLHTTETFDTYKAYLPIERIHRGPQILPAYKMSLKSVSEKSAPSGLMVASGCRLGFMQNQMRVSMLLLPVARYFAEKTLPIYLTYFLFLDSAQRAETRIKLRDRFQFYDLLASYSVILRTLIRYLIIHQTSAVAKSMRLPFELYGDQDWTKIFPAEYQGKYITQEDLEKKLETRVLVDPTPSTTYLVQHPMIPRYLFMGGSVLAPSTWDAPGNSSLSRFYFRSFDELQTSVSRLLESPRASDEERDSLIRDFGSQWISDAIDAKKSTALTQSEVFEKMNAGDLKTVREFGEYLVSIFELTYLKSSKKEVLDRILKSSAPDFAKDIEFFVRDEKSYLKGVREKYPFFNFF